MSNKKIIKRRPEPVQKQKKEQKKEPIFTKSRMRLAGLIPAIVFIAISIWYFISSMH